MRMESQDKTDGAVKPGLVLTNENLSSWRRRWGPYPREVREKCKKGMASESTQEGGREGRQSIQCGVGNGAKEADVAWPCLAV